MIGRRLPDGDFPELAGDYSKHEMPVGFSDGRVERHTVWLMKSPAGGSVFFIGRPNPDGSAFHWVRENDDGTITVEPNPPDAPTERRNSNSILAPDRRHPWHGYIYEGIWAAC